MATRLSILDRSGDSTITWDHSDPAGVAEARAMVDRLKAAGYSFFLTNGEPADEVAAGGGTLVVRRLSADEVIESPRPAVDVPAAEAPGISDDPAPPRKRRGRPPKADRNVVAVRPLAGG